MYTLQLCNRRKERERQKLEGKGKKKSSKKSKSKTNTSTSTTTKTDKKEKKKDEGSEEEDDKPDTSKDFELAQELGLGRAAKMPSGVETKRQMALAQLRKDKNKSADESDMEDYGNDDSEEDDEDYADNRPWMNKNKKPAFTGYSSNDDNYDSYGKKSKTFVEADVNDFMKVTIPRRRLSRWCNEPYFEQAVMNFYVRLAIGRDAKTSKPCYRLCKIVGIKENREYKFPLYPGQKQVRLILNWNKVSLYLQRYKYHIYFSTTQMLIINAICLY